MNLDLRLASLEKLKGRSPAMLNQKFDAILADEKLDALSQLRAAQSFMAELSDKELDGFVDLINKTGGREAMEAAFEEFKKDPSSLERAWLDLASTHSEEKS